MTCLLDVRSSASGSLVEMHHQRADQACLGDNVVLNIKGVDKNDSRRSRDAMVCKKDTTLG